MADRHPALSRWLGRYLPIRAMIKARPQNVAALTFNPGRDPEWIGGSKRPDVLGPLPYGKATRVRRHGSFLGRSFSWVTEVTEFEANRLVRMRHVSGPLTGGVGCGITPHGNGSKVTIPNDGEASLCLPFKGP